MTVQGFCLHSSMRQEAESCIYIPARHHASTFQESAAGHRSALYGAEYGDKPASLLCHQLPWSIAGEEYVCEGDIDCDMCLDAALVMVFCLGVMPLADLLKRLV